MYVVPWDFICCRLRHYFILKKKISTSAALSLVQITEVSGIFVKMNHRKVHGGFTDSSNNRAERTTLCVQLRTSLCVFVFPAIVRQRLIPPLVSYRRLSRLPELIIKGKNSILHTLSARPHVSQSVMCLSACL